MATFSRFIKVSIDRYIYSGTIKFINFSLYIYIEIHKEVLKMKQIITIQGKPVIDIYESFDGSYWFITEKAHKQDSVIEGKIYQDDQILFGFVRLSACPEFAEWGYISETELRLLGARVWKVPRRNWPVCPLVEVQPGPEQGQRQDNEGTRSPRPAEIMSRGVERR
jgi:hypothetical protein